MNNFNHLAVSTVGNAGVIKINRPEVYNALNKEAKAELVTAVEHLSKNKDLRCLILTGEGKAFCTGQDLNDRGSQSEDDKPRDLGVTLETEWNPVIRAIRASRLPVIGAINGVTAGAGVSIAVACDMLVVAPSVKFISGFSKIGLCPDAGSTFAFVRAIGYQKTVEFFTFNDPLPADYLQEKGLVNIIADEPFEMALSVAKRLDTVAPLSVEVIKENAKAALESTHKEMLAQEVEGQRKLGFSEDFKEGVQAFFDKRPPEFKGL